MQMEKMQVVMKRRGMEEDKELRALAKQMFNPADKNPYNQGEIAIRNLEELKNNLNLFSEREAEWLASWIEYLGDALTAEKIRMSTGNFKKIISQRCEQLKRHFNV